MSVRAALGEDGRDRLGQDLDVQPDRLVVQVVEVELDGKTVQENGVWAE